jgi:hypothetical protein
MQTVSPTIQGKRTGTLGKNLLVGDVTEQGAAQLDWEPLTSRSLRRRDRAAIGAANVVVPIS